MGFSPGQVHHGFNVTKEMTVKPSWGERVIPNFISMVTGQSLESHLLRASLQAASWPLTLDPSAPTAILWASVLGAATTHPLLCAPATLQLCHHVAWSTGRSSLYRVNSNVLLTQV